MDSTCQTVDGADREVTLKSCYRLQVESCRLSWPATSICNLKGVRGPTNCRIGTSRLLHAGLQLDDIVRRGFAHSG
jgi:hypothetical protein